MSAADASCAMCGALPEPGRPACWLCGHPSSPSEAPSDRPERTSRTPEPPPAPSAAEDKRELDASSLAALAALLLAIVGAFAISFDAGFAASVICGIPLATTFGQAFLGWGSSPGGSEKRSAAISKPAPRLAKGPLRPSKKPAPPSPTLGMALKALAMIGLLFAAIGVAVFVTCGFLLFGLH